MRMRTIPQAVKEIKGEDPGSAISYHAVRSMINDEVLPCVKAGGRMLIDLDVLAGLLAGEPIE